MEELRTTNCFLYCTLEKVGLTAMLKVAPPCWIEKNDEPTMEVKVSSENPKAEAVALNTDAESERIVWLYASFFTTENSNGIPENITLTVLWTFRSL